MRPRCILRCFTRFGINILAGPRGLGLRFAALRHDVAAIDPRFHADRPEGRDRRRATELDVGAERVQRHAALALPLPSGHLRAAEPTSDRYAHALRAALHRARHGLLEHLAEGDALLELLGDGIGDELRVDLGHADLDDVHLHRLARALAQRLPELFDLGAALPDDDARLRGVDRHRDLIHRALDVDPGHARVAEALLDRAAELGVLLDEVRVVAAGVPLRRPGLRRAEAEPQRVHLMTHLARLLFLCRLSRRHRLRGRRTRRARRSPHRAGTT